MVNCNFSNSQTYNKFFAPVSELLSSCHNQYFCKELSDSQWIQMGACRVLMEATSGRGFLQQHGCFFENAPACGHFFGTLRSSRRLNLCQEFNENLCDHVTETLTDPLAAFEELKQFDVYAGDGHWHGAAAHDKPREGRKWAVGHFYTLNMRSHGMKHLEMADEMERKHEHDMRALKRQSIQELRQKAPKGQKVLYAWDSACLDYNQWDSWKCQGGIYFITRMKEGLVYDILKYQPIDRENPVNRGVLSDQLIKPTGGKLMRRIECVDPVTGTHHVFLTNELTLSAGLLAQIYRLRWDLEKVFDQFKNSLHEQKAWASSENAKNMQAQFLCIAHNLMLLMEHELEKCFGVTNEAEIKRKEERLKKMMSSADKCGRKVSIFYQIVQRFTKRSLKFIRCLRAYFFIPAPLSQMASYLRTLYAHL